MRVDIKHVAAGRNAERSGGSIQRRLMSRITENVVIVGRRSHLQTLVKRLTVVRRSGATSLRVIITFPVSSCSAAIRSARLNQASGREAGDKGDESGRSVFTFHF